MEPKNDKPLSEWTLGEIYKHCKDRSAGFDFSETGVECQECRFNTICVVTPEEWDLTEKHRLTEKELAICKALEAKWVSRNDNGNSVLLWGDKPSLEEGCGKYYYGAVMIADVCFWEFPSVRPGDCIYVEEVISDAG